MSGVPSVSLGRCLFALIVVKVALVVASMRRIVSTIDRRAPRAMPNELVTHDELERLARQVATVAAFFPGRARCLEQSLVIYAMLRRAGVPAELKLGVRPHPFEAHAWVEHRGQPVLEDPEKIARFVPLPVAR